MNNYQAINNFLWLPREKKQFFMALILIADMHEPIPSTTMSSLRECWSIS